MGGRTVLEADPQKQQGTTGKWYQGGTKDCKKPRYLLCPYIYTNSIITVPATIYTRLEVPSFVLPPMWYIAIICQQCSSGFNIRQIYQILHKRSNERKIGIFQLSRILHSRSQSLEKWGFNNIVKQEIQKVWEFRISQKVSTNTMDIFTQLLIDKVFVICLACTLH